MGLRRQCWMFAAAIAAACASLPQSSAHAQELRGVVRDSMSRQPIAGAVILLRDSTGATLGRNITNERGAYRVALSPGMTRVHLQRIGFRPRDATIPRPEGGVATLDVSMVMIPHLLEATRVVDNPNCSRRDDRAPAFALWEQTQAALLATVVAREANPPRVVRYSFDRAMDGDGKRAVSQKVFVDTAQTDKPFVAAESAESFVDHGFADDSAGIRIYHGPDADVLLDDAFARGYCFGIAKPDASRPRQVGLSFEPAKHQRNRIDIDGAVWIDTASRALVDLVWRYDGLDYHFDRYAPGGRVSFHTMPNGSVMIDHWIIRVVGGSTASVNANGRLSVNGIRVAENGGELADARWADGQAWHATLPSVQGSARLHGLPAAGRTIRLVETPYEATVDSAGHFYISDLVPGPYEIGVVDSSLMSIGLLLTSNLHFTAVRDSTTQLAFEVATPQAFAGAACDGTVEGASDPVLVGRVVLPNGAAAANAKIAVRIEENGNLRDVASGKTNERGLFTLCHIPRHVTLFVRAELDGYNPASGLAQMDAMVTTIDLHLKRTTAR